jgi:hypothetical protein
VNQDSALQTIFSIFLGLMVTAFVGVGVYTFHPSPQADLFRQVQNLDRQEQAVRNSRPPDALAPADRDRIQELNTARNALNDAVRTEREAWGRSTSIILLVFATLAMAASLVGADRLPVISNGLLLGGVFTMLYGVGWISMTGTSIGRFVVMMAALVITLGLGYVRFVRRAVPGEARAPQSADLAGLDRRVRDLEARMNDAASALGPRPRQ